MVRKYKRYTDEFKRNALEMATKGEVRIAQLERDLGGMPGLIYKWRQRYHVDETNAELQSNAEREAEAEIRRLKRELAIAREERDILKSLKSSAKIVCYDLRIHCQSSRPIQCSADV